MGDRFNQTVDSVKWPSGLRSLSFGSRFNQKMDMTPLGDLETLIFGDCFTMKLDGLPEKLRSVTFGYESQDIDKLPTSLESLTFQPRVNQTETDFPDGLKHLTFGRRFNLSLDGMNLPSGLQSLTFDYHFDQSLDHLKFPSQPQQFEVWLLL